MGYDILMQQLPHVTIIRADNPMNLANAINRQVVLAFTETGNSPRVEFTSEYAAVIVNRFHEKAPHEDDDKAMRNITGFAEWISKNNYNMQGNGEWISRIDYSVVAEDTEDLYELYVASTVVVGAKPDEECDMCHKGTPRQTGNMFVCTKCGENVS